MYQPQEHDHDHVRETGNEQGRTTVELSETNKSGIQWEISLAGNKLPNYRHGRVTASRPPDKRKISRVDRGRFRDCVASLDCTSEKPQWLTGVKFCGGEKWKIWILNIKFQRRVFNSFRDNNKKPFFVQYIAFCLYGHYEASVIDRCKILRMRRLEEMDFEYKISILSI